MPKTLEKPVNPSVLGYYSYPQGYGFSALAYN